MFDEALLESAHVGDSQGTQIEHGASAFRNDVAACAAIDNARGNGRAAAQIAPALNTRNLLRQFLNGIHALFRRKSGMRGTSMGDDFRFTDSLALGLQQSARPECGFQHKYRIAALCFELDQLA